MRRLRATLLTAATLAVVSLALIATPSDARIVGQKLPFGLEPVGFPNAIAIDQANGNVYITDHTTNAVKIFGGEGGVPAQGAPSEVTGEKAGAPEGEFNFGGFHEPAGVAIDNSSSANAGDLYVADTRNHVVDRFTLEGGKYKYVCQFTGFGGTGNECSAGAHPTELFGEVGGVTVDSHGDVYISTFTPHKVYEFDAAGEDQRVAHIPNGEPSGLAVNASGIVYLQNYQGSVSKLIPNATPEFQVEEFSGNLGGKAYAIAVDQETNEVYIDLRIGNEFSVVVYNEQGSLLRELLADESRASEGVAINEKAENLYASNYNSSGVEVFHLTKVPNVKLTGQPNVEPFGATVKGEIEPESTTEPQYYFEYGPVREFPFSTAKEDVESVSRYLPAEAHLENLEPNTEYSYRLVGTDNSGLVEKSEEGKLRTSPEKPEVIETQANNITPTSAIFSGKVNPENTLPTSYHFEYEGEGCPKIPKCTATILPSVDIGASSASPIPVEQALEVGAKLAPDTTYVLRLVAENPIGKVTEAKTFTTPSEFSSAGGPPEVTTGPAESVSLNGATLTGTVDPDGLPTLYAFEYGTGGVYSTVIFGGEAGSGQESVAVTQPIGGLLSGVVYMYRIVGFSPAGIVVGASGTFLTPSAPAGAPQPSTPALLATPFFPEVKYPPLKPPAPGHGKKKKAHHKKHKSRGKANKVRRK
jgi:sugar lactone lactonase YvrE